MTSETNKQKISSGVDPNPSGITSRKFASSVSRTRQWKGGDASSDQRNELTGFPRSKLIRGDKLGTFPGFRERHLVFSERAGCQRFSDKGEEGGQDQLPKAL